MDIGADGFLNLMDPDSCDTKDDLKLPDDTTLSTQIREAFEKDETGIMVGWILALDMISIKNCWNIAKFCGFG